MTRKHRGFFMEVDGHQAHVIGDPKMDQRTKDALAAVIRAAYKRYAKEPHFGKPADRIKANYGVELRPQVGALTERIRRNQRGEP